MTVATDPAASPTPVPYASSVVDPLARVDALADRVPLPLVATAAFAIVGLSAFFPWATVTLTLLGDSMTTSAPPANAASPFSAFVVLVASVGLAAAAYGGRAGMPRVIGVAALSLVVLLFQLIGTFTAGPSAAGMGGNPFLGGSDAGDLFDVMPSAVVVLAFLATLVGAAACVYGDLRATRR